MKIVRPVCLIPLAALKPNANEAICVKSSCPLCMITNRAAKAIAFTISNRLDYLTLRPNKANSTKTPVIEPIL